jgi:hypothetical protein
MKIGLGHVPETRKMDEVISTKISFKPFVNYLEDRLKTEKTSKAKLYKMVLEEFYKDPVSRGYINVEEIPQHVKLLELIYVILSPFTADEKEYLWALSAPASKQLFYGTDACAILVEGDNSAEIESNSAYEEKERIKKRFQTFAYKMILDKYYNLDPIRGERILYSQLDAGLGLTRYYEVRQDTRFVEINYKEPLPALHCDTPGMYVQHGQMTEHLRDVLPLANFYLEGFTVITLEDITEDHAIEIIKKALITHMDADLLFERVRYGLKLLGGSKDIEFGMLPFISINGKFIFDDVECSQSVMINAVRKRNTNMAAVYNSAEEYMQRPEMRIFPVIGEEEKTRNPHIYALAEIGIRSYAVLPVFYNQTLVGVLEVFSRTEDVQYEQILARVNNAIPLIAQLLQNSIDQFDAKISNIIREQFTAVQPAVQWKFNEVALDYYRDLHAGNNNAVIGTASFHNVYPLYGMIDIRNSTIERNHALARDIDNLLNLLHIEEKNICKLLNDDSAAGVQNEFVKWHAAISLFLNSGDSGLLNLFLQTETIPYLRALLNSNPEANGPVSRLKDILEQEGAEISENRDRLESAMQKINTALNKFFAGERKALMKIYPCYFETFRTDGVEYDLYAGQSISPANEFLPQHLEAFRIWQLRSTIKAAGITKKVLKKKDWQLSTTQLIYVNPHPINISFRNDERHFDVDGGYNIRYQIIKKRVDKVHIRDTGERLTQPGKIAIVYYNDADARLYLQYIKTLQRERLLDEQIENVELEDLQGVYGLKAIRVAVL